MRVGARQKGAGQEGGKMSREGHEQRNRSGRTRSIGFVELMGKDFDPHCDESMSYIDLPKTPPCQLPPLLLRSRRQRLARGNGNAPALLHNVSLNLLCASPTVCPLPFTVAFKATLTATRLPHHPPHSSTPPAALLRSNHTRLTLLLLPPALLLLRPHCQQPAGHDGDAARPSAGHMDRLSQLNGP